MSDQKQEDSFRVIDRRPFTSEGELRKEVVEEKEREATREAVHPAPSVLGAYADPRTGQPVIDPDAAHELIDMLDALREKTMGNLAPEEDEMLLDLLGKLKMTYLEVNQAIAKQATQAKASTRS